MSNLPAIREYVESNATQNRLALTLGYTNPNDEKGRAEAQRYASSVLMELQKIASSGDDKKMAILKCTPQSIGQAMIDAAKFRLMIDGRQHAHLVKYANEATLQIGYRGYIAKIAEHYENADLNVFPVYKGDKLEILGKNGFDEYVHERSNPFNDSFADLQGVAGVLYYTKGGQAFQKIVTMSKSEIEKVKKAAKQTYVWDSWYVEMAKKSLIKRICKIQFASLSILQEMVAYDNQKHFDIEKPVIQMREGSIIDNLNKKLLGTPSDDVIDQPIEEKPQYVKDAAAIIRAINECEEKISLNTYWDDPLTKNELEAVRKANPATADFVENKYSERVGALNELEGNQ